MFIKSPLISLTLYNSTPLRILGTPLAVTYI